MGIVTGVGEVEMEQVSAAGKQVGVLSYLLTLWYIIVKSSSHISYLKCV